MEFLLRFIESCRFITGKGKGLKQVLIAQEFLF